MLDCWLDASTLVNEEELVKKGVQIAESEPGLRVYHGALPKPSKTSSRDASQPIKHSRRIVLAKVVIGHALATQNDKTAAVDVMPEGYDSFYLMENSNPDAYNHQYFVKSGAQILPQYILQFEFDAEKEKRSRDKARCDNCEVSVATVFCQADAANLCRNCDEKLHTANKLASRHIRTPIGKVSFPLRWKVPYSYFKIGCGRIRYLPNTSRQDGRILLL